MDRPNAFLQLVSDEQDDLLATIQLVSGHPDLEDRLLDRLVDRLLDGLLAELRQQYETGELDDRAYRLALSELVGQARRAGLTTLVVRDGFGR